MPTYADLYNERLAAQGHSLPSNPVRLTISKGDYVWDPATSRFRYEEQWEEEHLMEYEDLEDLQPQAFDQKPIIDPEPNHHSLKHISEIREESHHDNADLLQPLLLRGTAHQSLWVLDTNTLMSCLDLLKALFASLLTHNVASAAASNPEVRPPALIRLVIPYIVISELDGLKTTRRKDDNGRSVAALAREANSWILTALQKQKRVPIDSNGTNLPRHLHPLYVEPSNHYNRNRNKGSSSHTFDQDQTNDEQIIHFCYQLKQAAGSDSTTTGVWFCSDDINARTRAEMDGVDSLGVRELARALKSQSSATKSTEQRMQLLADALIEQWQYQVGVEASVPQLQPRLQQHLHEHIVVAPNGHHNYQQTPPPVRAAVPSSSLSPRESRTHTIEEAMQEDDLSQTASTIVHMNSNPVTESNPLSIPSRAPGGPQNSFAASLEGRSTEHSIHAPSHRRASPQHTQGKLPTYVSTFQNGTTDAIDAPTADELNPQISWDELVRQTRARGRP